MMRGPSCLGDQAARKGSRMSVCKWGPEAEYKQSEGTEAQPRPQDTGRTGATPHSMVARAFHPSLPSLVYEAVLPMDAPICATHWGHRPRARPAWTSGHPLSLRATSHSSLRVSRVSWCCCFLGWVTQLTSGPK